MSVGNIDVVLDRKQSGAFDAVSERIEERMRGILGEGAQKTAQLRQEIATSLAEETEQLSDLASQATDASEVLGALESLRNYQSSREKIIEQREQEISEALETAMAAIRSADEKSAQRLESLRDSVVTKIRQELTSVKERLERDIDDKNQQIAIQFNQLIKTIEKSAVDTFKQVVDSSREGLEKIAEDYGAQVSLLFSALTTDRVRRIKNASGIQEFDIHFPKQAEARDTGEAEVKAPPKEEPA